jgi:hypothetical protein
VHRLSQDPRFAGVVVFRIDFDSGKEYMRLVKATERSTLIAFKGKDEKARSVAETDAAALRKLFEAAL